MELASFCLSILFLPGSTGRQAKVIFIAVTEVASADKAAGEGNICDAFVGL